MTMTNQHQDIKMAKSVVEEIQNFFAIGAELSEEDTATLNDRLVREIENANARLRRCDDLLRRGLRTEAIQEAERSPNILELVAELDFADAESWGEYVRSHSLPPAPELLLAIAGEINEAYNAVQPLEKLLRTHRIYAIARSPLSQRLKLLRTIAEKDSQNPAWQEDLKSYEKARFLELENEFQQALNSRSRGQMEGLLRELIGSNWKNQPSSRLVEKVTKVHARYQQEDAKKRLKDLEKQINDQYSQFNLPRMQELRAEWDKNLAIAEVSESDELHLMVQPAFAWLDEELESAETTRARTAALAKLESALDDEKTERAELTRLMNVVLRFDEPIPERLQIRFDETLHRLDLKGKRKTAMTISGLVALILVLGVIAGVVIYWQIQRSEVARTNEALETMIENRQVHDAQSFVEKIETEKPHISRDTTFVALKQQLDGLVKSENSRVAEFEALLTAAEQSGVNSPSWNGCNAAIEQLGQARKMAEQSESDTDLARVLRLLKKVEEEKYKIQVAKDKAYAEKLEELKKQLNSMNGMKDHEVEELLVKAKELEHPRQVSEAAVKSGGATVIVQRIKEFQASAASRSREEKLLDAIKSSVVNDRGNVSLLRGAIERFIKESPKSLRGIDFSETLALDHYGIISRLETWNGLIESWNRELTSDSTAATMLETGLKLKEFDDFPSAEKIEAYLPRLETLSKRKEASEEIGKLFEDELFTLYHLVQISENGKSITPKVYYFHGRPESEKASNITVSTLTDSLDLNKVAKSKRFNTSDLKSLGKDDKGNPQYFGPSPQLVFLKKNRDFINGSTEFEKKYCGLIYMLVKNETQMDPVLQLRLIQNVLASAQKGSREIKEAFAKFEELANKQKVSLVNFINPDDVNADKFRQKAEVNISGLEDPKVLYSNKVKPAVDKLKGPVKLPGVRWLGIAIKSNESQPQWLLYQNQSEKLPGDRDVYQHLKTGFVVVGKLEQGKLQILPDAKLKEGCPLFFLEGNDRGNE